MEKPKELTAKQLAFVAAVLTTRNTEEAAKKAGVAYRTACRWKTLPEVRAAIAAERSEMLARTADALGAAMAEGAEFLLGEVRSTSARPAEKLAAVRVIFSAGPPVVELRPWWPLSGWPLVARPRIDNFNYSLLTV